jgi:hypothetical protein
MIAKPDIAVAGEEPQADQLGQFWSPATVTLSWPPLEGVRAPSVQVSVVAPIRGEMTVDALRRAHLRAANDVLTAALLSLEQAIQLPRTRARTRSVR